MFNVRANQGKSSKRVRERNIQLVRIFLDIPQQVEKCGNPSDMSGAFEKQMKGEKKTKAFEMQA